MVVAVAVGVKVAGTGVCVLVGVGVIGNGINVTDGVTLGVCVGGVTPQGNPNSAVLVDKFTLMLPLVKHLS
jgi:hypothetical protein